MPQVSGCANNNQLQKMKKKKEGTKSFSKSGFGKPIIRTCHKVKITRRDEQRAFLQTANLFSHLVSFADLKAHLERKSSQLEGPLLFFKPN